jgi:uncharacterized protein YdeI (YjbR/CyaY-like superfamily)
MSNRDPRVDEYIRGAAPFARPVLRHIRGVVHEAAPGIGETLKWGMPHFQQDGIVCGMAAFKAHCAFWFWRGREIAGEAAPGNREGMGRQFGRITSVSDLPSRSRLRSLVRKAVRLNASWPRARAPRRESRAAALPRAFSAALARNPTAKKAFLAMSPGRRREYAEWIAEAKLEATRERRIKTAVEWISAGKPRNWKYVKDGKQPPAKTVTRKQSQ